MRLAITRPVEDAAGIGAALARAGHEVITAPLLQIQSLPPPEIPRLGWQAVLVTSANSLKALVAHPALPGLLDVACCCVGPASADAARALGFRDVRVAGGGLPELKALITRDLRPGAGPLLYLSGETVSGTLEVDGHDIRRVVLYAAVPAERLPPRLRQHIAAQSLDAVLLYSPRTARIWCGLLEADGLSSMARHVLHYCLSANVAAVLPPEYPVCIAAHRADAAMLALVNGA